MKKHPKRLAEAGISPARYAELQAVCEQYPEHVRQLRRAQAAAAPAPRKRGGAWRGPGASLPGNLAWIGARVRAIEASAERCAPKPVSAAVLESVVHARAWEYLRQPPCCGRRQFYDARIRFFILLDAELRETGS